MNYQVLTVKQHKNPIGNIKITKRECLDNISNSMYSYYAYLVYGKIYNSDNTRFRRFKFIVDFDADDYSEYLEYEEVKASKKAFNDYLDECINNHIEIMLSNMKWDYSNGEALVSFCNDTINRYNGKFSAGSSSTQKESEYYTTEKFESIATDLELKYIDYYDTVAFGFIVEAVKNTIDDLHGIKSLEVMHKHITENYI